MKKTGEVFSLRCEINLNLDLLDEPDFYWDRENLGHLYQQTISHLALKQRTRVMNEKIEHLTELLSLLSNHLNDRHHVRLEWYIIALIMLEVILELWHFW